MVILHSLDFEKSMSFSLVIANKLIVVDVLCDWYSKMFCVVKWNGSLSRVFSAGSGVRQGSCLSPAIFNMFMNAYIVNLRQSAIGCHILNINFG